MIYAMSDIHGCAQEFEVALASVDLGNPENQLILLGDYCDRGPESLRVFQMVMELQKKYPGQVISLRGNHEEMLLEYVDMVSDPDFTRAWMLADSNLATARSFLGDQKFGRVKHLLALREFEEAYQYAVGESFPLDVIAGHTGTATVSGIPGYKGIWYDGASHYFIDGNVLDNGRVLVLAYDPVTGEYSGEGLER